MKSWIPILLLLSISISFSQDEYLDFTVQTHTYNGEYKPENCGVIWIETDDGQFVRTLKVWADKRITRLVKWQAVSFGNVTDAITSATIKTHEFHTVRWDMKDYNKNTVENGDYNILVECTEDDSNKPTKPDGKFVIVPFSKTGFTDYFEIEDDEFFSEMTISYHAQPNSVTDNTNVDIQAYPNPFTDHVSILVQTEELGNVEITLVNALGEEIESIDFQDQGSNQYQVNLYADELAAGVYFCLVKVGENVSTHKIIKL